jgi:hypothetical protein
MCAAPPTVEHAGLLGALREAARSDVGGEVIVKSDSRTARLYTTGRRVAWVTASTVHTTLSGRLIADGLVAERDLKAVFAECKATGKNFAETLIAWELIEAEALRAALLGHIAECLAAVFSWPQPTTMFVPCSRTYRGSLTFSIGELLESAARHESAQGTCLPGLLASAANSLEESQTGLLEEGSRSVGTRVLAFVPAADRSAALRVVVDEIAAIEGTRAVAILRGDTVLMEQDPAGVGIPLVATALATLLTRSASVCTTIGVGAPVEVAVTTPQGTAMARTFIDGEDQAHVVAILLEPDANQALVRHRLDKALAQGPL